MYKIHVELTVTVDVINFIHATLHKLCFEYDPKTSG